MRESNNFLKRAVTFLLLLSMIISIVPTNIIIVAESGISFSEMEIGALYYAEFDYSTYPDFYLYGDGKGTSSHQSTEMKSDFPQSLTVKKVQDSDIYVYVTNEDWPSKFANYRYIDPAELIITGKCEIDEPDDGFIRGEVGLSVDGESVTKIVLEKGEKSHVFTQLSEKISENAKYQWQLLVPGNGWANIADYILPYATISEALIQNALNDEGVAYVRCLVTDGEITYVSDEIAVCQDKLTVSLLSMRGNVNNLSLTNTTNSNVGETTVAADDDSSPADAFHITIVYKFLHENPANPEHNGSMAANTFTLSFGKGDQYTGEIISPPIPGYKPYREVLEGENVPATDIINYGGKTLVPADTYKFQNQRDKIVVTVYYVPQTVYYRVQYYKQNPQDDRYTDWKTEYRQGIPDTAVGDTLAPAEAGFNALAYDTNAIITNDGLAVIEVYYDRIYYLVKYDIGEDSYGVMPSYVRYGTNVMLGSPTNPGYAFDKWELTSVKDTIDGPELITNNNFSQYRVTAAYSQITVAHNLVYTAKWKQANTSYTIVYWLEDPEYEDPTDGSEPDKSRKYKVWGTETITNVLSGSIVNGPGANDVPTDLTTSSAQVKVDVDTKYTINLLNYLDFIESDKGVVVEGDGSTIVNVYYDRKEYTLKFYYARKKGNQWSVCSRSNAFGNESNSNNRTDEILLLDGLGDDDFGNVTGQPTFNKNFDETKYSFGSDKSKSNNNVYYYYFSFTAKYGEDISDRYPCDVFESVNRTSNNNPNNGHSNKPAFMSAWTGEYNVLFSWIGGNQTLKGKVQILDYRMLWHQQSTHWNNTTYNNQTVCYVSFWENARDEGGWNIPELYRYNIWVPKLDGQDLTGKTTMVRNGITYYLLDSYDTCDNSNVKEQTQPVLKGFDPDGRLPTADDPTSLFDTTSKPDYVLQKDYDEIRTQAMKNLYANAYVVNYFYKRQEPKLIFFDSHNGHKDVPVKFGEELLPYASTRPDYPSTVEANAMVFAGIDSTETGWYLDKGLAMPYTFSGTMDVSNIQLYAKWNPTMWNVKVYMDEAQTHQVYDSSVEFGKLLPEPNYKEFQTNNPEYKDLIFAGWYYTDENGNDVRFDFNTMAIKRDYVVFAKWTSTVPIAYLVRYVIEDGNGGYIDIADPSKGMSLVGVTKSFVAKVANDLYPEYRKYLPTSRSITKEMSNVAADNTILFVYKTVQTVEYTVKHVFKSDKLTALYGTDTYTVSWNYSIIGSEDSFSGSLIVRFDADLEEKIKAQPNGKKLWEIVTELSPNAYRQELILIVGDATDNEAVFNWENRGATYMYQEVHKFPNLDGGYDEVYRDCIGTYDAKGNSTVTATHDTDIQGFVPKGNTTVSANFNKTFTDERVLVLEYERVVYNYKVEYKYGNTLLAPAVNGTAKYEQKVTVNAPTIAGYTVDGASTKTEAITFEGQIITFYYVAEKVIFNYSVIGGEGGSVSNPQERININEVAGGSTPSAFAGYIFAGWFTDAEGTTPVSPAWVDSNNKITPVATVADADKSITFFAKFVPTSITITNLVNFGTPPDEDQVFVYLIEGNGISLRVAVVGVQGMQTIYALPIGNYSITVESDWSWRYSENISSFNVTLNDEIYQTFTYEIIDTTTVGDVGYFSNAD